MGIDMHFTKDWKPSAIHKTAAEMYARGERACDISKQVNRTTTTLYQWKTNERFKDLIEKYRKEQMMEAGAEYQARLRKLISKSMEKAEKMLEKDDDSTHMELLKTFLKTKHLGVAAFGPVAGGAKEEVTLKHENLPVIKVQYGDNEPESS